MVDIISAMVFLDMFSSEQQVITCERMVSFWKPFEKKGEGLERQVIFGRQMASSAHGSREEEDAVSGGHRELFIRDLDTFGKLWKEVGEKTGTKWVFEGHLKPLPWKKVDEIVSAGTAQVVEWAVWRVG